MDSSSEPRSEAEFGVLLALMVSIVALVTDISLPGLATIGVIILFGRTRLRNYSLAIALLITARAPTGNSGLASRTSLK